MKSNLSCNSITDVPIEEWDIDILVDCMVF